MKRAQTRAGHPAQVRDTHENKRQLSATAPEWHNPTRGPTFDLEPFDLPLPFPLSLAIFIYSNGLNEEVEVKGERLVSTWWCGCCFFFFGCGCQFCQRSRNGAETGDHRS